MKKAMIVRGWDAISPALPYISASRKAKKIPMPAPLGVTLLWMLRSFGMSTRPTRGAIRISRPIEANAAVKAIREAKSM